MKLPGVRIIGDRAFNDCKALADVEFGNKLERIGHGAFDGTALRSINIPKVRTIGNYAFYDFEQLTEVDLSEDLDTIGYEAFEE